jgi:hypothetical protein
LAKGETELPVHTNPGVAAATMLNVSPRIVDNAMVRRKLRLSDALDPVKLGAARHRCAREAASDAVGMA